MPDVKFCGLTRAVDAARAAELGAHFAGVIFAGGPRLIDAARAREVFAPLAGTSVRRVGVFGGQGVDEILRIAVRVPLDVIQLAGDSSLDGLSRLRGAFSGVVWRVVRVEGGANSAVELDSVLGAMLAASRAADAVVLDAAVVGMLGGTGVALSWETLRPAVSRFRARGVEGTALVLAGGLTSRNVARAVGLVRPDVVDVSSGVEEAPGVKDPELMSAFAAAARAPVDEER